MIKVRLFGGLGNQMFQYAAGRALALKHKTKLCLDVTFFGFNLPWITKRNFSLGVFNISGDIQRSSFFSFLIWRIFHRGEMYFQSFKYFVGFEDVIRNDFTFKNTFSEKTTLLLKEIENCESVGIHIRRGDYVGSNFHQSLGLEYYQKGIEYIAERRNIEKIFIFSDDIKWCKENIKFEYPTVFVSDEYSGLYGEGHMKLLSICKNLIIANSSFSWWSAWLSKNSKKIIIAPKKWFKNKLIDDFMPKEWVKI